MQRLWEGMDMRRIKSPTKTQEFLKDRTIVDIKHEPKKLILTLDNGNIFEIASYCDGWDTYGYGLTFGFKRENKS